jgi:hypothetical protein
MSEIYNRKNATVRQAIAEKILQTLLSRTELMTVGDVFRICNIWAVVPLQEVMNTALMLVDCNLIEKVRCYAGERESRRRICTTKTGLMLTIAGRNEALALSKQLHKAA